MALVLGLARTRWRDVAVRRWSSRRPDADGDERDAEVALTRFLDPTVVPLVEAPVVPLRTGVARILKNTGGKLAHKKLRFGRKKRNWGLKF